MDGPSFADYEEIPTDPTLLSDIVVDLSMAYMQDVDVGSPADLRWGYPGWRVIDAGVPGLALVYRWTPALVPTPDSSPWIAAYRAALLAAGRWDIRAAEDLPFPALYVRRPTPRHLDTPPARVTVDPPAPYAAGVNYGRLAGPGRSLADDYQLPYFGGNPAAECRAVVGAGGVLLPVHDPIVPPTTAAREREFQHGRD